MSERENGGPAFPVTQYVNADGETFESKSKGMSLRDYFAAKALAGGLEQGVEHNMADGQRDAWWHPPGKLARRAYEIADAMLKARKA
jgi:hypothetical protein